MESRPARLWILDDDEQLCDLLIQQCRTSGWQLDVFTHPRELHHTLANSCPDLLLLDQMLPEKLGTDVLESLRQDGHRFPVLMLSALGAPSDRILGLEHGADDYLGKPFLFRELQLRVHFHFRASTPAGRELIPLTELMLSRDLSYSETFALAKAQEEAELFAAMQSDIVQQVLRRLARLPLKP